MELKYLRYFHVVAREGSFTKAARALRVQQPTISKMVQQLEAQLGSVLFDRHKHGVRLTSAGGEIFRICDDIFGRVDEIEAISQAEKTVCQGVLSFGMTDSATTYVLPEILGGFLKDHPKVRPSVFAGSSNLICNEIADGRVEFGVSFTWPSGDDFAVRELAEVPFQLVVATKVVKRRDIRSCLIISRDIDYPKARPFPVLEMLRRHRVKADTILSSNSLDLQKQMVLEGMGIALLPRFMVKNAISRGTLTVLHAKTPFTYTFKLVTRRRKVLSRSAAVFLEHFKKEIQAYL